MRVMELLRNVLMWTCLVGIIAFFLHRELQITSMKVSEEIFIRAKRGDVYPSLLDVRLFVGMNPLATGLSDVTKGKTEDGLEEIHFVIEDTIDLLGVYQYKLNIFAVLQEVQPTARIRITGKVPGKLDFEVSWLLLDYRDGDQDGVLFIDQSEYTGMRFLVTFAVQEAAKSHRIFLGKLKARIESEKQ